MRIVGILVFLVGIGLIIESVISLEDGKLGSPLGAIAFVLSFLVGAVLMAYALDEVLRPWLRDDDR